MGTTQKQHFHHIIFICLLIGVVWGQECEEGFIWIEEPPLNEYNWDGNNCFYESDLNVLSEFIQINSSLIGQSLDIGWQYWVNGRLEALTLYALQITNVPNSIGILTGLNYLNLHFNQITSIPETIGELTQLTEIYLEVNQIVTLPESIGNLSNLITLNINDNQLTNIPESIGNLSNLETFLIFNNELTYLPEGICNIFSNLSYYDFSANNLCPPYPNCIENVGFQFTDNCPNCENGEVELWGDCYSIENTSEILLPSSGLIGIIPESIGNLINLNSLVLYNNQLSGELPESIGSLTNLTWLNLYNNQLTGEIPEDIGNLTNLNSLDLGFNQFIGEIPDSFGNLTNLIHLWLFNNQLNGEIPAIICNIYQDLDHFIIYNNQLCPPYPDCLTEEDIGYQNTLNCSSMPIKEPTLLKTFILNEPFPNPFNPTTSISFSIHEKSQTSIKFFDIKGDMISTILNETMIVGHHQIEWNAEGYPSGVYFVKLNAGEFTQTQKLMLVK